MDYATANGLDSSFAANFSSDANTDMSYAFYNAMGPGGEDISLTVLWRHHALGSLCRLPH